MGPDTLRLAAPKAIRGGWRYLEAVAVCVAR